jgi:hypothetical protein
MNLDELLDLRTDERDEEEDDLLFEEHQEHGFQEGCSFCEEEAEQDRAYEMDDLDARLGIIPSVRLRDEYDSHNHQLNPLER